MGLGQSGMDRCRRWRSPEARRHWASFAFTAPASTASPETGLRVVQRLGDDLPLPLHVRLTLRT
jgi:hypothetical protein